MTDRPRDRSVPSHPTRDGSATRRPTTTRRRWRTAVATGAVGLVLATGACSSSEEAAPEPPPGSGTTVPAAGAGTLRLGVRPLDSLDPADVVPTSQSAMVATDLLFDSLTAIDPATDDAVPALAAEARPDDVQTVWTFPLRDGATFSDGSPVTASDVKFSLERVARKGSASLAAVRLEIIAGYQAFVDGTATDITGIAVVDERTVQITTRAPYALLPQLLASPVYGVVPRAAVESLGATFGEEPVGSGPFAYDSTDGTTRRLTRAPGSAAKVDGVDLVAFATVDESYAAFEAGQVDWTAAPDDVAEGDVEDGTLVTEPFAAELFFAVNMANPSFADVRFRSAMVKAIDRRRLVTEVIGSPLPLDGVVPSSVTTNTDTDPCGDLCTYDPDAARALVAEVFPDGTVPTVELDFYQDPGETDTTQQELAEAIKADLEAVGIPVSLAPKPFAEYRTFAVSGGAQVFSYGWVGLAPNPDAYLAPLFLSDSPDNVTGYNNPFVDVFIADARTGDPATRDDRYRDIEKLVMSNVPIIPLAELQTRVVVGEGVDGYQANINGTFDVTAVSLSS